MEERAGERRCVFIGFPSPRSSPLVPRGERMESLMQPWGPGAIQEVVAAGNEADYAIKPIPPRYLVGYGVRSHARIHAEDRPHAGAGRCQHLPQEREANLPARRLPRKLSGFAAIPESALIPAPAAPSRTV